MPRTIAVFLFLLVQIPGSGVKGQGTERFARLLSTSEYETMIKELETLRSGDPQGFASSANSYLLARAYEKNGELANAAAAYAGAANRNDGLSLYAAKHLSRIARASGNLPLERLFLRELSFAVDSNLAAEGAPRRLAQNYFGSRDYPAAIDLIKNGYPHVEPAADASAKSRGLATLLANAYLAAGMTSEARSEFEAIIGSSPVPARPDDFSLAAVKGLDRLDLPGRGSESEVADLAVSEHRRRADIYQFNRDFKSARLHYEAIVESGEGGDLRSAAMFQIGRGYAQERQDEPAVAWFERLRKEFPRDKLAAAALYGAAGSLANLGETERAVRHYLLYIDSNPDAGNIERAYLNIVDAYRDAGKPDQALVWSRKAQSRFEGETGELIALFAEARVFIASAEWNRAYGALNRLSGMGLGRGPEIAGGTSKSEVLFLKSLALEKMGRIEEARAGYRDLGKDWRNYYGWRAADRLNSMKAGRSNPGKSAGRVPGRTGRNDRVIPGMKRARIELGKGVARRLLDLGLFDEGAPEAELILRESGNIENDDLTGLDPDIAFTLAEFYAKSGFADRAISLIEPKWKKVPRGLRADEIPLDHAMLLYPVPFRDSLLRHAGKHSVDPRFLLSIMRQESRYRSDIKSSAAARGLMQFISGTSSRIAEELGLANFGQDDLYDPDTAIRFGARYVSNIFRDFPGEMPAVAASYNAGEDRMARWMKRSNATDPDRYVPEIVFAQTKDYTYRVMSNYRMYDLLYGEDLLPRKSK